MLNKKKVFIIILILFFILAMVSFVQAASYQFTINNNNDEAEVYKLSVDIFSEYITFSENPTNIDGRKSKTITLTADVPCEKAGSYKANFIVYAQKSKKTIKIPFDVNVPSCYEYSIQLGEEVITKGITKITFKPYKGVYELCEDEKLSIPILITNTGQAKTFKFNLDGIDFAKLSGNKLFLKNNQRGVLYIILEPKDEGDYSFDLRIMTDKIRSIPLDLKIKKCYFVGVYLAPDNLTLCGCEPYSYDFFVGNEGIKKGTFGLELKGPRWVSLGLNQNFELESGGTISIPFNIDAPCFESKTYDVDIIAYLVDQKDVSGKDSVKITIVSKDDCYKTKIELKEKVTIDYSGISLPVKLTSYGAEKIDYSVSLEGPEWININYNTISLEPGDEKIINLDIKPSEGIEEGSYKIKINLDSEKASYSKDIMVKLKKKTLVLKNISEFYDSYSSYVGGSIMVILIIVVLLVLAVKRIKKIKIEKKRKKKIKKELIIWLITAFILAVSIYLIYRFSQLLLELIIWLRYYIYTLVVLLIIIYLISKYIKKKKEEKYEELKKVKEKKKAEKKRKKSKKYINYFLIIFAILVLAGIFVYFSIYYNLLQYIIEFFLIYYPYFVVGIVLLIALILLLRFYSSKKKKKKEKED